MALLVLAWLKFNTQLDQNSILAWLKLWHPEGSQWVRLVNRHLYSIRISMYIQSTNEVWWWSSSHVFMIRMVHGVTCALCMWHDAKASPLSYFGEGSKSQAPWPTTLGHLEKISSKPDREHCSLRLSSKKSCPCIFKGMPCPQNPYWVHLNFKAHNPTYMFTST